MGERVRERDVYGKIRLSVSTFPKVEERIYASHSMLFAFLFCVFMLVPTRLAPGPKIKHNIFTLIRVPVVLARTLRAGFLLLRKLKYLFEKIYFHGPLVEKL